MPENDITKMKVADLKRELKLRGLATTGNKNELQDRLQTALIDGDLSLEDSAIAGDDLLDEDGVLTDEEEEKILGDENELLKSPISTPALNLDIKTAGANTAEDAILESPTSVTASKKIVIKRKNSFSSTNIGDQFTKENTEPTSPKTVKLSHHIPITMGGSGDNEEKNKSAEVTSGATTKMTQLSLKERLEMRAKKFGLNANTATTTTTPTTASVSSGGAPAINDEKQIELLKKRAERFGCVVSSKIAKITADEKLLKRKERFGGEKAANSGTATTTNPDAWSEKARQRLERFKTTPTTTAVEATAAVSTAVGN